MGDPVTLDPALSAVPSIDPRRSLGAGVMWLIIGLALTFAIAAAAWVGSIARQNVLQQHVRRLSLETDQLGSDVSQAVASRLGALRAIGPILRAAQGSNSPGGLGAVFEELRSAYPQLGWIAIADSGGVVVSAAGALQKGGRVAADAWFSGGLQGPWLGVIDDVGGAAALAPTPGTADALGDLAAPIVDGNGRALGVVAAHLTRRRTPNHPLRLTDETDPQNVTQAYILDRAGIVRIGPPELRGKPWPGVAVARAGFSPPWPASEQSSGIPRFERLPDGRRVLVSRALLPVGSDLAARGWQVQLSEPIERVYQRADSVAVQILWVALGLGAATAILGAFGARHLTRRLQRLTRSVGSVGRAEGAGIEVPAGRDEVAQLAAAFATLLEDLQEERSDLKALSSELERRVALRTHEVEQLAAEARYAAVVRERLQIARDLHDTLAHSMMAMLSEIRLLRRLQVHDPAAMPAELARAEQVAHEGLKEARTAIAQMRVTAVRETGLGPALSTTFERFVDRTGLTGECTVDTAAAGFGDERAETLLRMAQEALRNVERHADATRVTVSLRARDGGCVELLVADDGVGFDPSAPHPDHYGIVGLREQAILIGAELRIESAPNEGTKLSVSLRLPPVDFAADQLLDSRERQGHAFRVDGGSKL